MRTPCRDVQAAQKMRAGAETNFVFRSQSDPTENPLWCGIGIRPVRKAYGFLSGLAFFQADALQKCCFKLVDPESSVSGQPC